MMIDVFNQYIKKLKGKFFKILPLSEGIDFNTKKIIHSKEDSYNSLQKYLSKLSIELDGAKRNYPNVVEFIEISNIISGMSSIGIDEHEKLRTTTFQLISLCENILKGAY